MPRFHRTAPCPEVVGGYRSYRPFVRADFECLCAYCLIRELHCGGEECYELDHFRPRSRFPELERDFYNLYYACHPCNGIKRDKWPSAQLQQKGIGIVDLCREEFHEHFDAGGDGRWKGLTASAEYTIELLRLNRPHLVELRNLLINWDSGR
jgi:hypothetical protein